jgi:hypothetical protein
MVENRSFSIDVNIMGLRDLESFGLIPVRKPFVKLYVK